MTQRKFGADNFQNAAIELKRGRVDLSKNDGSAESIAAWVNSQIHDEQERMGPETTLRLQQSTLYSAESDALREYLPRDERDELIGPSGGYED